MSMIRKSSWSKAAELVVDDVTVDAVDVAAEVDKLTTVESVRQPRRLVPTGQCIEVVDLGTVVVADVVLEVE